MIRLVWAQASLVQPCQVPGRQARDEGAANHVGRGELVGQGGQEDRIGEQGAEVGELCAPVAEGGTHRVLHPRVGGQDEDRGQHRARGGHVDGQQVQFFRKPVPAEDPHADEGGLQEKGQQCLQRQRGAENIAHETGVLGPVHAELEFLHDAGHHSRREIDQEKLPEEFREPEVVVISDAVPEGLQDRDEHRQRDRERHEQKVVDRGDPELPSGNDGRVHAA